MKKLSSLIYNKLALSTEKVNQIFALPKPNFIFIMGHMRSGSSLLCHILMNNSAIMGMGESNRTYTISTHLWKLVFKSWQVNRKILPKITYYVDQINHNRFLTDSQIIKNYPVKYIFLIREPNASINSILKLSQKYYNNSWTFKKAEEYYHERLEFLLNFAQQLPSNTFKWTTYKELTLDTEATLEKLNTFLELSNNLTPEYQQYSFTGQRGDPSNNLKLGKVQPPLSVENFDFNLSNKTVDVYLRSLKFINQIK